jgi:hypothetical protein
MRTTFNAKTPRRKDFSNPFAVRLECYQWVTANRFPMVVVFYAFTLRLCTFAPLR